MKKRSSYLGAKTLCFALNKEQNDFEWAVETFIQIPVNPNPQDVTT